jgi:hypothetical protein
MNFKNLKPRLINKAYSLFSNKIGEALETIKIEPNITRTDIRAGNAWDNLIGPITEELASHPMTFLRCPTISITVHPNQLDLAEKYFEAMLPDAFFQEKLLPRLCDPPMGNPYLCPFFPITSPISVQHNYYLMLIHQYLGEDLSTNNHIRHITEIGGGYGNLCRVIIANGYKGKYVIVDLPEMHQMQKHYLKYACPQVLEQNQVTFLGTDNPGLAANNDKSGFLFGTFSVCEMPMDLRLDLEKYYNKFEYLFFTYYIAYDGVDNVAYFKQLETKLSLLYTVYHFQDFARRAWFLIAKRNNP